SKGRRMDYDIVAGIEYPQIGVGVEPTDNVEVAVVGRAVLVEFRPRVGRECEMHRAVVGAGGGQCCLDLDYEARLVSIGVAQQRAAQFAVHITATVGGDLEYRRLVNQHYR